MINFSHHQPYTQGMKIRALVISDILLFRDGMAAGLSRLGDLDIIATVSPDEAVAFLSESSADIAILDTSRRRALAQAVALKSACPSLHIIAFGIGAHEDAIAGAESGVSAFVGRDGSIEDINKAAIQAMHGQCYCSPELTAHLLTHIASLARQTPAPSNVRLTNREEEIASLVKDGLSNKEIGQMLKISPATVKNHVHSILEKLDLNRRSAIGARLNQITANQIGNMIS